MVLVPGPTKTLCIDNTEITQAQYSAFLGSSPPTTGQPQGCGTNSSFTPTCNYTPGSTPDKPVVCVDWCDAFAYCKAAGKRLCGAIGGGSVPPGSEADPNKSQWHFACSMNGQRSYPYGSLYSKFACVGLDNTNYYLPQNVGTQPVCQGGYSLIYDMSGNVSEWEDSCSTGGACAARGGHYLSSQSAIACAAVATFGRMTTDKSRGFRCCAD